MRDAIEAVCPWVRTELLWRITNNKRAAWKAEKTVRRLVDI
jgi:hypothetical protein